MVVTIIIICILIYSSKKDESTARLSSFYTFVKSDLDFNNYKFLLIFLLLALFLIIGILVFLVDFVIFAFFLLTFAYYLQNLAHV